MRPHRPDVRVLPAVTALAVVAATLSAGLAALAAPASAAPSTTVVINEVYGGGGNSGATYTNDFIELYNRSNAAVDVSTWSVQYNSAAGTNAYQLTRLTGSIPAGAHYLIQEAAGATTGTALPTPDATGTLALSATAGKVALVTNQTALAAASASNAAGIQDFVGFGTTANTFETAAAPAPSNTTSISRNAAGADTDNNSTDFTTGAPSPQNVAAGGGTTSDQPISATCGGTLAATQGMAASRAVSATDSDSIVNGASITSAAVSGITLDAVTPATANGGTLTATLDVASTTAAGSYSVVIGFTNSTNQTASCTVPVTVTAAGTALKIDQIQGNGLLSPYAGSNGAVGTTSVTFQGIVTGVAGNGYYVEDPTPDSDPLTSEGVFVFAGSATKPTVGQSISVTGKVQEFQPTTDGLSVTEITGTPTFSVLATALPALPAPVMVGPGALQAPAQAVDADYPDGNYSASATHTNIETDGHTLSPTRNAADFYEVIEGMRVTLTGALAVGPDDPAFGELPVLPADASGNPGTGTATTFRGGALYSGYNTPNARRITLDDENYKGGATSATPLANVGAVLGGLTGELTYSFGSPFLELNSAPTLVSNTLARTTASPAPAGSLSIGSLNLENLSPGDTAAKFSSLGTEVVTALGAPDILNAQEVQDNDGATDSGTVDASQTYSKLIAAISAAGGPTYSYVQIDPQNDQDGGQPGGNIRQGLLYRTDTGLVLRAGTAGDSTTADSVTTGTDGQPHLALNPGRIKPADTAAWSASRKPLAVEFVRNGRSLFVINNHFRSKGGDSPLFGRIQPPTRTSEDQRVLQSDDVNQFVASILAVDATADVAVVGDLNDYSFSPALARLKAGNILTDLITQLPANQQYNYVFGGNSQQLDHTLVSQHLTSTANPQLSVARQNSEFNDQVSDHEPEVARLTFATPPAALPETRVSALLLVTGLGVAGVLVARRRRRTA